MTGWGGRGSRPNIFKIKKTKERTFSPFLFNAVKYYIGSQIGIMYLPDFRESGVAADFAQKYVIADAIEAADSP